MDMIINQENFNLFVKKLANGVRRADSYTSGNNSTNEPVRAYRMREALGEFIIRLEAAGYCPFKTMNNLMKPYKQWVEGDKIPGLKQQIDSNLRIDMSDFQQALDYCEIQWDTLQKKVI